MTTTEAPACGCWQFTHLGHCMHVLIGDTRTCPDCADPRKAGA